MPSLTDVFSKVQLENETDGIVLLQGLLENAYDKSPAMVASLQKAISDIGAPPPDTTRSTTTSKSTTS